MAKTKRQPWSQSLIKALFGRAANRCPICKCRITELPEVGGDKIVVLGQVAHIHALSSDGPRGTSKLTTKQKNAIENLIVVCANCHNRIDRKEVTYTVLELKRIKSEHETYYENVAPSMDTKDATVLINSYIQEFYAAYSPYALNYVPGEFIIDKQIVSYADEALQKAIANNVLILGGSGLGKSHLAKSLAIRSLDNGDVVVIVEAIQFSKQINPQIESQSRFTLEQLRLACFMLKKSILLIIDGYNECPEGLHMKLNLWIIGFINQTNATLIITSQNPPNGLDNVHLKVLEVVRPSDSTKTEIASVSDRNVLERIGSLLVAVSTGLEAKLLGKVAQSVKANASRFSIFELYARELFGNSAEVGIKALSHTAEFLYNKLTFSLSLRDFSRLMAEKLINVQSYDFLFISGLLIKRADRIFFGHELFYNAFAAEAIVRQTHGNSDKIIDALSLPKHRNQRDLVLGAIDDQDVLDSILPRITDFDLIAACIAGDCGPYAKSWADNKCAEILSFIQSEIAAISFEIVFKAGMNGVESWTVSLVEDSIYKWSDQERCFIHAFPLLLFKGKYTVEIFQVIGTMDDRLSSEFRRLRPEAIEKNIAIRSSMFEQIYLGFNRVRRTSANMILSNFISGGWSIDDIRPSNSVLDYVRELAGKSNLSDGKLYLLIHLIQRFQWHYDNWKLLLVPVLPSLLRDRWKSSPYHLKLVILDAAHYSWDASKDQKDQIIAELNNLLEASGGDWIMPTFIIEALQGLGALAQDEIEYEDTVRNELRAIFGGQEDEHTFAAAFSFHIKSFDHPYEGAYWKVISDLSGNDAKKLYILALRGAIYSPTSMGTKIVLSQVAKYEDSSTAKYIQPFTKIPESNDSSPQDSTETCLMAHIVLGWMGVVIESQLSNELTDAAKSYIAYAEIMYWINRRDLTQDERQKSMKDAWMILLNKTTRTSLSALYAYSRIIQESLRSFADGRTVSISLPNAFPDEVAEICRAALANPEIQEAHFEWTGQSELLDHAIHLLGYYGKLSDLSKLKDFSADKFLGQTALKSIERIESRYSN